MGLKNWITGKGTGIVQVMGGRSNAFLVSSGERFLLVDTGAKFARKGLERRLDALIPNREALTGLILTHIHFDHVGNAAYIRKRYVTAAFTQECEEKNAKLGVNAAIHGAIAPTRLAFAAIGGDKTLAKPSFEPFSSDVAVQDARDLSDLGVNAYLVHTPGHTPGSMSLVVDGEIAIVGDAMFGVFPGSIFPPWATDAPLMVESWKRLLDAGCELFLPGHGTERDRALVEREYRRHEAKFRARASRKVGALS